MQTVSSLVNVVRHTGDVGHVVVTTALDRIDRVRVASDFVARAVGLLNRTHLAADEGLIIAPGGSVHTFGMRFAIDVVFLDETLTVLGIESNMPPWRVALAPRRTKYVLELAANRCAQLGILLGRAIELKTDEATCPRSQNSLTAAR